MISEEEKISMLVATGARVYRSIIVQVPEGHNGFAEYTLDQAFDKLFPCEELLRTRQKTHGQAMCKEFHTIVWNGNINLISGNTRCECGRHTYKELIGPGLRIVRP